MKVSTSVVKVLALAMALPILSSCVSKKKYTEAITRAAAEKSALESSLAAAQEENEKLKGQMGELEQNLNMKSEEIVVLSQEIKVSQEKVGQLKNAISDAFETYDENDVNVELRNGKLYVTMSNSILFESGRDRLTDASKEAIATLASVIKKNPGLAIFIEGHTDAEPVKVHKRQFTDNWGLSVARSVSVVRELQANGVEPGRLTASGKGDTQPVAANDTDENMEKNRRTEFVIAPKIDGLYKMYKNDFASMSGDSN